MISKESLEKFTKIHKITLQEKKHLRKILKCGKKVDVLHVELQTYSIELNNSSNVKFYLKFRNERN